MDNDIHDGVGTTEDDIIGVADADVSAGANGGGDDVGNSGASAPAHPHLVNVWNVA